MSSAPHVNLYPVMVVEDRYGGTYIHGRWWAIARGDDLFDGLPRVMWLAEHGPGSDDVSCSVVWSEPPPWIAVGDTPDAVLISLRAQEGAATDDWIAPGWEMNSARATDLSPGFRWEATDFLIRCHGLSGRARLTSGKPPGLASGKSPNAIWIKVRGENGPKSGAVYRPEKLS